ncbi:ribonuclease HII [Leptolyngbya sp. 'hensonii']|uniref:ribonuclease HII n=1 Tax=Leptolyngbya sp. 'hensonii' TaxID=1922337 RepID=UPI00094F4BB2|nr:ribonuclease HII [Leptolyngbya sp. 'hensonii']OLP18802.1 ribonuclease HII [Leptolyngbya sp. 'hensonii']
MQSTQLSLLEEFRDAHIPERIAGVDEVGRGCLFGPVVAAAVILPPLAEPHLIALGVTDSKQISATERQFLATQIQAMALSCRIGTASVREIDRLNILGASLLAMKRAIRRLTPQPELCLIDGNQLIPDLDLPQQPLVRGDSRCLAIAAASIIAKVWRDQLIIRLADRYPGYDLAANKGYGTAKHRAALARYGPTPYHRLSFSPCHAARERAL